MDRKRRMTAAGIFGMLLSCTLHVNAGDVLNMGRIYTYMPEISLELYGLESSENEDITVMLGEEKLDVKEVHAYDSKKDSTKIYVLLDVSTSMAGRLDRLKVPLTQLAEGVGNQDELVLVSFGERVTQRLNGTEDKETRKRVINELQPNEEGTVLYKALSEVYESARETQSAFSREYILLLTDGIDFQKGNQTYAEIEGKFKSHVLPIYTICTENVTQEAADTLGELTRTSGGMFQVVSDGQEAGGFEAVKKKISGAKIVELEAASNRISGKEELLTVRAGEDVVEQKVEITRFIPDNVPPEIAEVSINKENSRISVRFTEPVERAGEKGAVRVTDDTGKFVPVKNVEYIEGKNVLYVYLETQLSEGQYRLETQGITDMSQEKNPLVEYKGAVTANKIEPVKKIKKWWFAAIGAVVLTAAGITAWILQGRKKKILEVQKEADEEKQREEKILPPQPEESERYRILQSNGKKVRVYMKLPDSSERQFSLKIVSSVIVGRGRACDVIVEDERMSRQHFAIEAQKDKLILEDLNSANGTKVNGVPLKGRVTLRYGDKISAGGTEIVITE